MRKDTADTKTMRDIAQAPRCKLLSPKGPEADFANLEQLKKIFFNADQRTCLPLPAGRNLTQIRADYSAELSATICVRSAKSALRK